MTGALRKNVHAERTRTEPIAEGWLPMTAHTLFGKFTLRAALALLACLLIGPGSLAHAQAEPDDASPAATHTVLITGANRGIGLELARQYSAAGWRVIGTARKPDAATELRELATMIVQLDVTDPVSVEELARELADMPIDLLINNAGIQPLMWTLEDVDFDEYGNLVWMVEDSSDGIPAAQKRVIYWDGHTDTVRALRSQWRETLGGVDAYDGLRAGEPLDRDALRLGVPAFGEVAGERAFDQRVTRPVGVAYPQEVPAALAHEVVALLRREIEDAHRVRLGRHGLGHGGGRLGAGQAADAARRGAPRRVRSWR